MHILMLGWGKQGHLFINASDSSDSDSEFDSDEENPLSNYDLSSEDS